MTPQMNTEPSVNTVFVNLGFNWWCKANSNPIKPNLPEGKIDAKCVVTKDYEEKCGQGL